MKKQQVLNSDSNSPKYPIKAFIIIATLSFVFGIDKPTGELNVENRVSISLPT